MEGLAHIYQSLKDHIMHPILARCRSLPTWLSSQLTTLFLFTKDDFKTLVIPATIFASAAGPYTSPKALLEAVFWIWLHLLQFTISNQTLKPEEDEYNKPHRPLPSKRISLKNAKRLRWFLIPVCVGWSATYSTHTAAASSAMLLGTIAYNELEMHASHWLIRGCVNAWNMGSTEVGATLIAGNDRARLDNVGILAVLLSVTIYATTIHTSDFKDCEGDRLIGRKTMPITMPTTARPLTFAVMFVWSIILSYLWDLASLQAAAFCGMGLYIGLRFLALESVRDDKVSFNWYNLWLTLAHVLPGIWRFKASGTPYAAALLW